MIDFATYQTIIDPPFHPLSVQKKAADKKKQVCCGLKERGDILILISVCKYITYFTLGGVTRQADVSILSVWTTNNLCR